MSISHADFYRLLPKVLETYKYSIKSPVINVNIKNGKLIIQLNEQTTHKIASLELPSTKVDFEFINVEENDIDNFFKEFEITYRRGGG